ncbi:hypothetical protein [Nonlabens tegetincola]|nr:hypothetical protein [Nonlabens tegetincola]
MKRTSNFWKGILLVILPMIMGYVVALLWLINAFIEIYNLIESWVV